MINYNKYPRLSVAYDSQQKGMENFIAEHFDLFYYIEPEIENNKFTGYSYKIIKLNTLDRDEIKSISVFGNRNECKMLMMDRVYQLCETELYADEIKSSQVPDFYDIA